MTDLISPWLPEPDPLTHQALGKAAEEANELAGILARCLIQGLKEKEPVTGKPNRQALQEEMSDVTAAILWIEYQLGIKPDPARVARKLAGFKRWGNMIAGHDEEPATETPAPVPHVWGGPETSPDLYRTVHDAATAVYEASTPADYRYSASALRQAVDAGIRAALASEGPAE